MTTIVKVEAHCNPETTEVRIVQTGQPDATIQDGEIHETAVWDEDMIVVQEVDKRRK